MRACIATTRSPSAMVVASGFSQSTSRPASMAATATSACRKFGTHRSTSCTSRSAISSAYVAYARGMR